MNLDLTAPTPLSIPCKRSRVVALENLLGNAWKYTSGVSPARIEVGTGLGSGQREGKRFFFVRDNGVGFDMTGREKLFRPFQRLRLRVISKP